MLIVSIITKYQTYPSPPILYIPLKTQEHKNSEKKVSLQSFQSYRVGTESYFHHFRFTPNGKVEALLS